MKRRLSILCLLIWAVLSFADEYPADYARAPRFHALIYYSTNVEEAHLQFAEQAVDFFHRLSYGEGFTYDVVTDFTAYDRSDKLAPYDLVIMLNDAPHSAESRKAFEEYMENGGGWLGFHAAAYNDANTHWPWLNTFLGCGTFYCNNWPPQPALIEVEKSLTPRQKGHKKEAEISRADVSMRNSEHIVRSSEHIVRSVPESFVSAPSEWYMWNPSPRENKEVRILASLSPRNFPLGVKDIIYHGDFPIAWTNTRYRMVYFNFGHGNQSFLSMEQNLLIINAVTWLTAGIKRD